MARVSHTASLLNSGRSIADRRGEKLGGNIQGQRLSGIHHFSGCWDAIGYEYLYSAIEEGFAEGGCVDDLEVFNGCQCGTGTIRM